MVLRRIDTAPEDFHPAYVVWELTLACDQPCTHCGSRAGTARAGELSTEEALGVVAQLAAMRAREVVLIGGEAYLHPGFLDIIRALKAAGIRPMLTTGGRGLNAELAEEMARAGLHRGLGERGWPGGDARPDARGPGQLRGGHGGAGTPEGRGGADGRQHQPEPPQPGGPGGAVRAPEGAGDRRVADPNHRAARAGGGPAGSCSCSRGTWSS